MRAQENDGQNATQNQDALNRELEELRELFQMELDRAREGAEDAQAASAPKMPPPKESDAAPTCECCGAKLTKQEIADSAPYCAACEEALYARPIRPAATLCVLLAFFLAALCMYFSVNSTVEWRTVSAAEQAAQQGQLYDAYAQYSDYFTAKTQNDALSLTALKHFINLCLTIGVPDSAATLVETYFPKTALRLPQNTKYRNIAAKQAREQATWTAANEIFADYEDFTDPAQYTDADARLCALLKEDAYDRFFVEYIRYLLMQAAKQPNEVLCTQLQVLEACDDGSNRSYWLPGRIELAGHMQDEETAAAYFQQAIALNSQDQSAYLAYAHALRYLESPDAEKLLTLFRAAQTNASDATLPVYYDIYAAALLLQGDSEKALQVMQTYESVCAYTSGSLSKAEYNLYALCAAAAGDTETYKDIAGYFANAELTLALPVRQVKAGRLTVREALQNDGGEIA